MTKNSKVKITGVTKKEVLFNLWSRDPKVNRETAAKCLGMSVRTIHRHIAEFENLHGAKPEFGKNGAKISADEANKILQGDFDKQTYDATADVMTEEQLGVDLDEFKIEADIKPGQTSSTTVFGKTLEEEPNTDDVIKLAISKAGVNPESWDVGQCKVNFWHTSMKVRVVDNRNKNGYLHRVIRVTNWSVRITLIPNRTPFVLHAMRELVDSIPPLEPLVLGSLAVPSKEQFAGALAPIDIHFGKFAWNNETMCGHMDLGIAKRVFIESCMKNLEDMAKYPLSKIFFIVGQDLMHFENYAAETPKGRHHLDVDGRLPKAIKTTKESFIYIVDQAMQIAPVEIIRVPGNHDMHASYWLVELMRERYRHNKHVIVDNGVYSDSPYKLIRWGNLIVGMMHNAAGNRVPRAINAVPQFWRKDWGESRYSELWVGHQHKKVDTKTFPVNSVGSTLIRQLSALCTNDFWHFDELWIDAVPACEAFVLDKQDGVIANLKRNIDYLGITDEIEAIEKEKSKGATVGRWTMP